MLWGRRPFPAGSAEGGCCPGCGGLLEWLEFALTSFLSGLPSELASRTCPAVAASPGRMSHLRVPVTDPAAGIGGQGDAGPPSMGGPCRLLGPDPRRLSFLVCEMQTQASQCLGGQITSPWSKRLSAPLRSPSSTRKHQHQPAPGVSSAPPPKGILLRAPRPPAAATILAAKPATRKVSLAKMALSQGWPRAPWGCFSAKRLLRPAHTLCASCLRPPLSAMGL